MPRIARALGPTTIQPASLPDEADPSHHLWKNGRLWWVAFTVHLPGWRKERIRRSLRTADLAEARRRRDEILRACEEIEGCRLSLRYPERDPPPTGGGQITRRYSLRSSVQTGTPQ